MKKFLAFTVATILSLTALFSLTACGNKAKWNGVSADFSSLDANAQIVGSFIGQTDNYVYYINGLATSTEDNTLGVPVKGALMAAKKTDLTKTEVVVPKLFAGSDYNAGVYIYGEYVYYGTPSLDKNSSGQIANYEMAFMKTKLDGTGSELLFTIPTLSAEYRIAQKDGKVSIVYYDADSSSIKCFDLSSKTTTTIATTDATADKSLSAYKFLDNSAVKGGVSVVYTVTVYSEKYYEDKASQEDYSRATESYNLMYVLKAGESEGTLVGNGAETKMTYAVTMVDGDNVYFTETDEKSEVKTYVSTALALGSTDKVEIKNAGYAVDANVIISKDEVYSLTEGKIYKVSLVGEDKDCKKVVAIASSASTLLTVKDGYAYYYNASNNLVRIELGNQDANEQLVSEDTVSTAWYAPVFMTVGEKDYVFYLDNSNTGLSYVKYVDLDGDVIAEDTDDDKEDDKFYLNGHAFLGKLLDSDQASIFTAKVGKIATDNVVSGALQFEEVTSDGVTTLTVKAVTDARKEYEEVLTASVKELIEEATLTTLANYERAITIANLYKKLDAVRNYETLSETEKQAVKTAYESIKADVTAFKAESNYTTIRDLLGSDLNRNYQKADGLFNE